MKWLFTLVFSFSASLALQAQLMPAPANPQPQVPASKSKLYVRGNTTVYIRCPNSTRWTRYQIQEGNYYVTVNNCGSGDPRQGKCIKLCGTCQEYRLEGGRRYRVEGNRFEEHTK